MVAAEAGWIPVPADTAFSTFADNVSRETDVAGASPGEGTG